MPQTKTAWNRSRAVYIGQAKADICVARARQARRKPEQWYAHCEDLQRGMASPQSQRSAFGELFAATGAVQTDLFTLDFAGVTRHEASF